MKKYIYILCCFYSLLFLACRTTDSSKRWGKDVCMFIMIYDYENNAVNGVSVYKNNMLLGDSDIRGRYIIDKDRQTDFQLRFEKKGYETVYADVHFDPFAVLYIKMGTPGQFLHLAEEQTDAGLYKSALDYINTALKIETERNDILYFKAVVLYKMRKLEEAKQLLEQLKQKNVQNEYIELFENKIKQMQRSIKNEQS